MAEEILIAGGIKLASVAAKAAYNHAVQHQELALAIANRTEAELVYVDNYLQYGQPALCPPEQNIQSMGDNGWTFSKGQLSKIYGLNGLMRFTSGADTVFIAWNVPDPWGAWFPWMKKDHRNNFDVRVVATSDVEGMATKDIAEKHDLGNGIKLWQLDGRRKLQNLGEDVRFEFEVGRTATARMTENWKAGVLSVVVS